MTTLKIMANLYGTGPGIFNPISILWASEKAVATIGVDVVKKELKAINRNRTRLGLPIAVHPFGHELF